MACRSLADRPFVRYGTTRVGTPCSGPQRSRRGAGRRRGARARGPDSRLTTAAASIAEGPREPLGPRTPLTAESRPGGWLALTAAPSRRASDSVGLNLDTWSRTGAYTPERWPRLRAAIRQLGIRAARVDVHLVSGDWGTQRQIQLGQDGVRLTVQLGDAFGRFSAAPLDRVYDVFARQLLPYAEAVEGTNEPDLSGDPQWAVTALDHQRALVRALSGTPGTDRLAIYGPSSARPNNQQWFGDLTGLADYANAHAYSGGRTGSFGLDLFTPRPAGRLPGGPLVVTEAGWQTEPTGTFSQPGVSEAVAARYPPKLLLEGVRRGIPRTYLFDLVDRFEDPKLEKIHAHFGLLKVDGTPKPAFGSVARLMAELRDPAARCGPRPRRSSCGRERRCRRICAWSPCGTPTVRWCSHCGASGRCGTSPPARRRACHARPCGSSSVSGSPRRGSARSQAAARPGSCRSGVG